MDPKTGFYRNGCCDTDAEDQGMHTVCVEVTADFLDYSRARGNDLSTPVPEHGFKGLRPGDKWCLCAMRWKDALADGKAPKVYIAATHLETLDVVTLEELSRHAVDLN
jgi:uncharacterized protein (DUF2237 family)